MRMPARGQTEMQVSTCVHLRIRLARSLLAVQSNLYQRTVATVPVFFPYSLYTSIKSCWYAIVIRFYHPICLMLEKKSDETLRLAETYCSSILARGKKNFPVAMKVDDSVQITETARKLRRQLTIAKYKITCFQKICNCRPTNPLLPFFTCLEF